jgi:hypothetical protein
MKEYSKTAWDIASRFSGVLASETRDLAGMIDAVLPEWKPIDTAPRDEMFIWAYRREGRWLVGLAYRNVSGGWSDAYGNESAPERATHWAPMPAPPQS